MENHQIIDILPTRKYVDVAGCIDAQPQPGRSGSATGPGHVGNVYAAVYTVTLPKAAQVVDPFHLI